MTVAHEGACHCGAIGYRFHTAVAPFAWSIRACQCAFCRAHAALSTSDPAGRLEFFEHRPDSLHRYRFGLRTADFLLCRRCGIYIGAVIAIGGRRFGIVNTRALTVPDPAMAEPVPIEYEGEDVAARCARREARWTPVTIESAN
jgi:hypothetical protein